MDISKEVRELIAVPAYIDACANACAADLLNGPAYAVVPGNGIEEFTTDDLYELYDDVPEEDESRLENVYTGQVGDALRAFLSEIPSELYYEDWSGCLLESEPEGEWQDEEVDEDEDEDEDEPVWVEPEPYRVVGSSEIVEALFGRTIAREFN